MTEQASTAGIRTIEADLFGLKYVDSFAIVARKK